jgi:hypothetical protein
MKTASRPAPLSTGTIGFNRQPPGGRSTLASLRQSDNVLRWLPRAALLAGLLLP